MILDKIIQEKRKELSGKPYLNSFISKLKKSNRNFKKAISQKGINLIAEIKKASPSRGSIRKDFNLSKVVDAYDVDDVAAISILTDEKFFQGKLEYLTKVRKLTKKPLLRKDFIIDDYQIYEARHYGADAVLLIAAILTKGQIDRFIDVANKYNMDCLVEVHTSNELKNVLETKAEIIGINNRNLNSLRTDLNTTLRLINKIPKNKIIVSESGFSSKEDIEMIKGRVNSILVGTSLMKEKEIGKKINEFMRPKIKICGITNQKDALACKNNDIIGFNFYEKSPRYIKKDNAKKIISKLPKDVLKAGVFVNSSLDEVLNIVKSCKLDIVQLHGDEDNNFIRNVKTKTKKKVIKAIRVKTTKDVKAAEDFFDADFLLFDTKKNGIYGGTGKVFDWKLLRKVDKPFSWVVD